MGRRSSAPRASASIRSKTTFPSCSLTKRRSKTNSILLVRLRLIGDVILTTPVIRGIREAYPHARLTYLVEPLSAPVVRHNPHLDEVIVAAAADAPGRLRADVRLV